MLNIEFFSGSGATTGKINSGEFFSNCNNKYPVLYGEMYTPLFSLTSLEFHFQLI
jgi:hypothetical protein